MRIVRHILAAGIAADARFVAAMTTAKGHGKSGVRHRACSGYRLPMTRRDSRQISGRRKAANTPCRPNASPA